MIDTMVMIKIIAAAAAAAAAEKDQKEQMLKPCIIAIFTELIRSLLSSLINHHEYLGCFMQLYYGMIAQDAVFFLHACDLSLRSKSPNVELDSRG